MMKTFAPIAAAALVLLAGCSSGPAPAPADAPSERSVVTLRYATAAAAPGENEALARALEDRIGGVEGLGEMRSVCTSRGIQIAVVVTGPDREAAIEAVREIAARFESEHPELRRRPDVEKEDGR